MVGLWTATVLGDHAFILLAQFFPNLPAAFFDQAYSYTLYPYHALLFE